MTQLEILYSTYKTYKTKLKLMNFSCKLVARNDWAALITVNKGSEVGDKDKDAFKTYTIIKLNPITNYQSATVIQDIHGKTYQITDNFIQIFEERVIDTKYNNCFVVVKPHNGNMIDVIEKEYKIQPLKLHSTKDGVLIKSGWKGYEVRMLSYADRTEILLINCNRVQILLSSSGEFKDKRELGIKDNIQIILCKCTRHEDIPGIYYLHVYKYNNPKDKCIVMIDDNLNMLANHIDV